MKTVAQVLLLAAASLLISVNPAFADSNIRINGRILSVAKTRQLALLLGTPIPPGRYWYDRVSGLWGRRGQGPAGQLQPQLPIEGRLPTFASGRHATKVFINGRLIHPVERNMLVSLYGGVLPGRYWLGPDGTFGREGGPPQGNLLLQLAARQQAQPKRPYARPHRSGRAAGGSVWQSGIGGRPGIGVGRASDGCTYVSYGGYSTESCP